MKRCLMTFCAVLIALVTYAAPATAAGELGVSQDGTTWAPTFSGPLFDNAIHWVPGDSRTATFFIRNQSTDTAGLAITMLGDHVGSLMDSGDITVSATGGGGVSVPTSDLGDQLLLIASDINGGEVVPIHVTVDFNENSPNDTQLLSTDLKFKVTLTQSSETNPDNPGDGNGTNGDGNGTNGSSSPLPDTGAGQLTWIVALGSILLGTGVAIVSRHRNNEQGESHV